MVDPSVSPRGLGGMRFNMAGIPSELCAFLWQRRDATTTTTTTKEACSSVHGEEGKWALPGMIYDPAEHLI